LAPKIRFQEADLMQKVERVRDGLDQAVTKAASMNMENGKDEQGKLSELFFSWECS